MYKKLQTNRICFICLNEGRPAHEPTDTIISEQYLTPSTKTDDATRTETMSYVFLLQLSILTSTQVTSFSSLPAAFKCVQVSVFFLWVGVECVCCWCVCVCFLRVPVSQKIKKVYPTGQKVFLLVWQWCVAYYSRADISLHWELIFQSL